MSDDKGNGDEMAGLVAAYAPPERPGDGDVMAIAGQGFGYAPFRAARIFRVLTGALSAVPAYAGGNVWEYSDGSPTGVTVLGKAFTVLSGGSGEAAGESIVETGSFTDAEATTIKDNGSAIGIVKSDTHFLVRGVMVKPILAFTILNTVVANAIKSRRSDPFFRDRADGGPSLREELMDQVLNASSVVIKDQQNQNKCEERLGNARLWSDGMVNGANRSDSFWYLNTSFISSAPGSDSVEVDIELGSLVTIAGRSNQVPTTGVDPVVAQFQVVYGFEIVLVGVPRLGNMSQRKTICGVPMARSQAAASDVQAVKDEVADLKGDLNDIKAMIARIASK